MRKALILTILIISLMPIGLCALSFKGNLPYMDNGETYEDIVSSSSDLTRFIYQVCSTPYSLSWLEEYVDEQMLPTFLMYHQQDISLLTTKKIIGITIDMKMSYSIVKIDGEDNLFSESLWRKNEDGQYVMFSIKQ